MINIKIDSDKKYQFTDETVNECGHILYRIEALKDLPHGIKKGDKGGFVEKKQNLSQEGFSWVGDNAKVIGKGVVEDDALVNKNAIVYGKVSDYAMVSGNVTVLDKGKVAGDAILVGDEIISGRIGFSKKIKTNTINFIIGAIAGTVSGASYIDAGGLTVSTIGSITGLAVGVSGFSKLKLTWYVAGVLTGVAGAFCLAAHIAGTNLADTAARPTIEPTPHRGQAPTWYLVREKAVFEKATTANRGKAPKAITFG